MKNLEKLKDSELVELALNGNKKQAFGVLYERYSENVFRYCMKLSANCDISQDLMQDVFLSAFTSLDGFKIEEDGSMVPYLFTIAYNKFINFYRHDKKSPINYVEEIYDSKSSSFHASHEENLIESERSEILRKIILNLGPRYKKIVDLRYFGGFQYKEIAEEMGLPVGTVKSRLFYVHKELRKKYKKFLFSNI